jgi:hypothetical protein
MTTVLSTNVTPRSSGNRPKKFDNFNDLGAYLLKERARPFKRLEQKPRLEPAVLRGLVAAVITWGARAAFIDPSGPAPLLVATARNGQSFTVAVTGNGQTWLRAAAAMPSSPEADDAGLFRYLSASEKVRSGQPPDQRRHNSATEALHHAIEHARLAA